MSENEVERDLGPGAVGDPENPGSPSTPVEQVPPRPVEDLKGAELEDALDEAGLPKSGTADEKRQRLAEHRGQPQQTEEGEQ